MNGIIYTRVSSREQVERTSLDSQERECRALAERQGVAIAKNHVFREEGESAKVVDRTELQKLLKYIQTNRDKIDVLYIWKIDRLSRNLGDYYGIKVALGKYGVKIVSVTEPIEDDPVGRFLEAILAAAAQFDNEIRAVRTVGGMRARVEQGEWPHSVAVGYLKEGKRVVVDPVLGPVIADILIRFSKGGYNYTDIAEYAFQRGIKTKSGKRKPTEAMKLILKNYIYCGLTVSKLTKTPTKGRHKALVPLEVIQKNRAIIDGTVNNYSLHGDDLFPLRGTLRCTTCNNYLTASSPRGRSGNYFPRYHCNRATCKQKVTGRPASRGIEEVHSDFRQLLRSLAPLDDGIAQLYKDIVVRVWNEKFRNSIDSIADLERRIASSEKFKADVTKKFIEDKITEEEKELQMSAANNELAALKVELDEVRRYKEQNASIVDTAMEFIKNPEYFWNQGSTPVKKMVQQFIAPNGIPYDFETGYGTARDVHSHLLISKITPEGDSKIDLVAATGIEPVTLGL